MSDSDPPRLTSLGTEVPGSLRQALESARQQSPSPAELAAIAAKLGDLLGPPVAAPPGLDPPGAVSGGVGSGLSAMSVGAKVVLAIAVTGALVGGVGYALRAAAPARPAASPPQAARALLPAEPPPEPPASEEVQGASEVAQQPEPARAQTHPTRRRRAVAKAVGPHEPLSAPEAGGSSSLPPNQARDEATELQLLAAARSLATSQPERALALAKEHQERFPASRLGQEREVIVLEALAKLGRSAEVRALAQQLLARDPASIHRRTIERLLREQEGR